MKDFLEEEGYTINSPREAIKQAFQSGIIDNGQQWLDALEDRSLTTHTYDESIAAKVVSTIRNSYPLVLRQLYSRMKNEAEK